MKIVLDTNVLVSGLLDPFGPPGEIVRLVSSGVLELCFDARILSEYREVLARPKFPITPDEIDAILDQIEACGLLVSAEPLSKELPDRDDRPFLEVALAGQAAYLVTGNLKHFPQRARQGVEVLSPGDYLSHFRKRRQ